MIQKTTSSDISEFTISEAIEKYIRTNGKAPKRLLLKKIEDNIVSTNNKCTKSNKAIAKSKKMIEKMDKQLDELRAENARIKSNMLQSLID